MNSGRYIPFWKRFAWLVIALLCAAAFFIPLWWSIVWGTWQTEVIFAFPPKFTIGPYLFDNLMRLQARLGIVRVFINSVLIAALSVVGALAFCTLGGFAFAKYRFPLRNVLFYALLATMAVPSQITSIPLFIIMAHIGWIDTYAGVVLPSLIPAFGVFLMRQSAESSISNELMEAGRLDGANELQIFFYIALPSLGPSIAALAILLFSGTWSALFWPIIVLRSSEMLTLPVALSSMLGGYEQPFDLLLAGSLLGLIPPLLVFLALQRFFVKSFITSAFK